jgi:transposase-like protein
LVLEKVQEGLVNDLCGPKYSRDKNRRFKRAGTTGRTLLTRHGRIEFMLAKVKSLENDSMLRPLLLYIGVEPRRRIIHDLVLECAEAATFLTYRDSKTVVESLTKTRISKHRIHSYVQEIGVLMEGERREEAVAETDLLYADGTKAHGLSGKKNEINVIVGKSLETGEKHLLGLSVNRDWSETASQFTGKADLLISDADRAMRNALIDKALRRQLCVNHVTREVSFHLWKAGLPKQERKGILTKLTTILQRLRNSAIKHLKDQDTQRLRWRINKTLADLKRLADELSKEGLVSVAKFIRSSANYTVTFAILAMKHIRVPSTNNLIERLMGEIAKRTKNRWMHWSTKGLENLLNILLTRYCNQNLYNRLKEKYLNQNNTTIQITIT